MNAQEALEIITNAIQSDNMTAEQDKALAIAQKALEKQIPKKALYENKYDDCVVYSCPACKDEKLILNGDNYCATCGQKLDWEDDKQ